MHRTRAHASKGKPRCSHIYTYYNRFLGKKQEKNQKLKTQVPIINDGGPSLFDRKIRSFLDACKNGGKAPVPTSQIIYNQAILDGIAKSAKLGREIEIEIPQV